MNGGVRDLEQIADVRFPVFGVNRCVKDIRTRGRMAEYGVAVTIGGVPVRPGDIVFGDANGVVVIPQDRYDDVLAELRAVLGKEQSTMRGLQEGRSAQALFGEYKVF